MPATYEPIASISAASASQVTFSNIAATWTDLILMWSGTGSTLFNIETQVNGDTGFNYSRTALLGDGSSASSFRAADDNKIRATASTFPSTTTPSVIMWHFMSYANVNVRKTVLISSSSASYGVARQVALWRSTSAITSIKVYIQDGYPSDTFTSGTFSLYGIKAA